jgi:hypothetical protein
LPERSAFRVGQYLPAVPALTVVDAQGVVTLGDED